MTWVLWWWLSCDGTSLIFKYADVTERLTMDRMGDAVRITHLYGKGDEVPPLRGCPRVMDYFEWRNGSLYYIRTDNYFDHTRVDYTPGHLWAKGDDGIGQVRWAWTEGQLYELIDADQDCVAEMVIPSGPKVRNLIWRALVPQEDGGMRLDEVTWVNGSRDDTWKESWFWKPNDPLPSRTVGLRNGRVIWDGYRVGVER